MLPVRFERRNEKEVDTKYIPPITIINIPKDLFFLKPLPLTYLIPIYIPKIQKERDIKERKRNGKSINILPPELRPKEVSTITPITKTRSINTQGTSISIPILLDLNCLFNIIVTVELV